jgi:hypothetical protein
MILEDGLSTSTRPGSHLFKPKYTHEQLKQLSTMYGHLSYALWGIIHLDKRTEKPVIDKASDFHERLRQFPDDRLNYDFLSPRGSRDTENHLSDAENCFVDVCCEVLTYLAGPQPGGVAPPICRTNASEWGLIGVTRKYDLSRQTRG